MSPSVDSCVPFQCTSGARMELVLDTRPCSSAQCFIVGMGGPLTVCRNTECYETILPDQATPGGARTALSFAGTDFVLGWVWENPDLTTGIEIDWRLDPQQIASGDHYVVVRGRLPQLPNAPARTLLDQVATYLPSAAPAGACPGSDTCQVAVLRP